jgi:hypothetical protein
VIRRSMSRNNSLSFYRLAPLVKGKKGEELREMIWQDVCDALQADIPDFSRLLAAL